MRRERQPGGFAFDNFDGRSLQAAGVVEFRNAVVDLVTRDHEKDRILPDADNNRTRFTLLEVFRPLDGSMLTRRDVAAHALFVLHHAAVGSKVNPALIRITGDNQTSSAYEASAVQFVNKWDRKLEKIDVIA